MKYLGIDPGRTIGYARLEVARDESSGAFVLTDIEVGQERREDWSSFDSYPLGLVSDCDVVAIEDFVGSGHRSSESNFVLKMIGAFEVVTLLTEGKPLIQAPAKRRKYLKLAERLYEKLKGKKPPKHGHDALAHALKAIAVEQGIHPDVFLGQ